MLSREVVARPVGSGGGAPPNLAVVVDVSDLTAAATCSGGKVLPAGARLCFHDDAKPIEIDT